MTLPSATLLAQSILSGVFVGALYGLMGLGLSLSWGRLRLIHLARLSFLFPGGADQPRALRVRVPCVLPLLSAREQGDGSAGDAADPRAGVLRAGRGLA